VTVTSPSGQVLGIDPATGLLGFVTPSSAGGAGSGSSGSGTTTFVLINPLDPSSPVEPGDPVVVLTSTGQYCAFRSSQTPLSCGTSGMVCNLDSPSAASTLTYRCVGECASALLLRLPPSCMKPGQACPDDCASFCARLRRLWLHARLRLSVGHGFPPKLELCILASTDITHTHPFAPTQLYRPQLPGRGSCPAVWQRCAGGNCKPTVCSAGQQPAVSGASNHR
jgi:hypothetical protein